MIDRISKEITAKAVAKIEAVSQSMAIDSNNNRGKQSPESIEQEAQKLSTKAIT